MGTRFSKEVWDEHGIGGDGEYYGDNDAQLGHLSARRAPTPELPRESKRGRGQQLGLRPLQKGWHKFC
jgi:hypothetical protein